MKIGYHYRMKRSESKAKGCIRVVLCAGLLSVLSGGCGQPEAKPGFVVTTPPLAMIVRELVGDRWPVVTLLDPGQSPHTYAPRPSDAALSEASLTLFSAADDLDGWAADLPAKRHVALIGLVPEAFRRTMPDEPGHEGHGHGDVDPHFWGDPLAVRAMLEPLAKALSEADPEGAAAYRANAARFGESLTALDESLRDMLAPVKGASVILFHPSWDYFLERYGIRVAGLVEPFAGKEATAKYLADLAALTERENVRAVLTEPQLARRPAEVVAEAAGVPCFEIDPLGGVPGRDSYAELLRHNAAVLLEALQ